MSFFFGAADVADAAETTQQTTGKMTPPLIIMTPGHGNPTIATITVTPGHMIIMITPGQTTLQMTTRCPAVWVMETTMVDTRYSNRDDKDGYSGAIY